MENIFYKFFRVLHGFVKINCWIIQKIMNFLWINWKLNHKYFEKSIFQSALKKKSTYIIEYSLLNNFHFFLFTRSSILFEIFLFEYWCAVDSSNMVECYIMRPCSRRTHVYFFIQIFHHNVEYWVMQWWVGSRAAWVNIPLHHVII